MKGNRGDKADATDVALFPLGPAGKRTAVMFCSLLALVAAYLGPGLLACIWTSLGQSAEALGIVLTRTGLLLVASAILQDVGAISGFWTTPRETKGQIRAVSGSELSGRVLSAREKWTLWYPIWILLLTLPNFFWAGFDGHCP
jgi:hypothetical protein